MTSPKEGLMSPNENPMSPNENPMSPNKDPTSRKEDLDIESLSLERLLQLHLNLEKSTCPWTVQSSRLHGQGLFAARGIEEGEVIFRDVALVLGPRSGPSRDPICVGCLSMSTHIRPCSKLCRLPVCSLQCEDSPQHATECEFLREYTNGEHRTQQANLPSGVPATKEQKESKDQYVQKSSVNEVCITNGNCNSGDIKQSLVQVNSGIQEKETKNEPGYHSKDNKVRGLSQPKGTTEINNNMKSFPQDGSTSASANGQPSGSRYNEDTIKDSDDSPHNSLSKQAIIDAASAQSPTVLEGLNLELVRSVTPLRCLQMSTLKRAIMKLLESIEHPICEVDILKRHLSQRPPMEIERYLRYCCGVLDTNAYGGTGHGKSLDFRGLYALSAIMNHSCTPNTTYWFDSESRMVVKAARPIRSGEEILSTYTSLLWGTATRRSFLNNTKSFLCRCKRCRDATEFGTYLSGINCKAKPCAGVLLPSNPLDVKSDWICNSGAKQHKIGAQKAFQVLNICSKVAEMLIQSEDLDQVVTFFKSIPDNAQSAIQIRKHFVLHAKGSITETSDVKLQFKEESCVKLLDLIAKLQLGGNYLRGLILQELFLVLQEKSTRSPDSQKDNQIIEKFKTESEMILSS